MEKRNIFTIGTAGIVNVRILIGLLKRYRYLLHTVMDKSFFFFFFWNGTEKLYKRIGITGSVWVISIMILLTYQKVCHRRKANFCSHHLCRCPLGCSFLWTDNLNLRDSFAFRPIVHDAGHPSQFIRLQCKSIDNLLHWRSMNGSTADDRANECSDCAWWSYLFGGLSYSFCWEGE